VCYLGLGISEKAEENYNKALNIVNLQRELMGDASLDMTEAELEED